MGAVCAAGIAVAVLLGGDRAAATEPWGIIG